MTYVPKRPCVLLVKTSSLTIANSTVTPIDWTSALKNDFNMWSAATPSVIGAIGAGIWRATLTVRWASQATATGLRQCGIWTATPPGADSEAAVYNLPMAAGVNSVNTVTQVVHPMLLADGDSVIAKVYHTAGVSLDMVATFTRLLVEKVS